MEDQIHLFDVLATALGSKYDLESEELEYLCDKLEGGGTKYV